LKFAARDPSGASGTSVPCSLRMGTSLSLKIFWHPSHVHCQMQGSSLVYMTLCILAQPEAGPLQDRVYKQRSIKGELIIESEASLDNSNISLHGIVKMSSAISEYTAPSGGDFTFAQSSGKGCRSFEVPIKITKCPSTADDLSPEVVNFGTIRLLAKRTVTGWNPDEDPSGKRIVSIDSVDDADELMWRWEKAFLANSWPNKHLSLPTELVLKIHEYVAFRPPPAFFFEEGDLWISTSVQKVDKSVLRTILVARRRNRRE